PVDAIVAVPDGLDLRDATAVLHDGPTALGLIDNARIRPREWVLVLAAGGGLGILLVQLMHAAGGRVIAAARGRRKLDLVRRLGAEVAVDYSEPDWAKRVLAATGPTAGTPRDDRTRRRTPEPPRRLLGERRRGGDRHRRPGTRRQSEVPKRQGRPTRLVRRRRHRSAGGVRRPGWPARSRARDQGPHRDARRGAATDARLHQRRDPDPSPSRRRLASRRARSQHA